MSRAERTASVPTRVPESVTSTADGICSAWSDSRIGVGAPVPSR
ncbi:hypothetical protein [Actinokineospora sp. HUAS TT18]